MNNKQKAIKAMSREEREYAEYLITEYSSLLSNVISNKLGNVYLYLAEECIGELYKLICEKIEIINNHENPKAWLIIAAKNISLETIRKHSNDLSTKPLEDNLNYATGNVDEDAIYNIWLENKVPEKLIARLTKRERQVYHKLYIEKKSPKEIAKELNIATSTVRNVNKKLRDKIIKDVKHKNF